MGTAVSCALPFRVERFHRLSPMPSGRPVHTDTPVKDLHPRFQQLIGTKLIEPARGCCARLRGVPDLDGNFVEQISRPPALMPHLGLFPVRDVQGPRPSHRARAAPRFHPCAHDGQEVCVEAVNSIPSADDGIPAYTNDPPDRSPEELQEYQRQEMAVRFGSPVGRYQRNIRHCRARRASRSIFAIQKLPCGALHFTNSTL